MLSVRKLGAVTSTILAVSVLASPASQAAPTDFAPLTVKKECSDFAVSGVPRFCTIIASSFRALKKVKVLYYGPHLGDNGQFLSSDVVLDDGPRGTAIGHCIVYFAAGPAGICTFTAGNGSLAGFRAVVKVTVDANMIWHWVGVESHGI